MKKILIVEDDSRIARALQVRLKAEGYEPIVAQDALTGARMAVELRPDLVLLDIMMSLAGGLGGLWVLKKLRSAAETAATPIIVITASKAPPLRERAIELGVAAFFEKPYDSEELLAAIRDALGRPTSAHEHAA